MIRINEHYSHLFIKCKSYWMYPINKGMYLTFDGKTREYTGIEMFYLPHDKHFPERAADKLVNELLSKDILELI